MSLILQHIKIRKEFNVGAYKRSSNDKKLFKRSIKNWYQSEKIYTVKSLFVAAATIEIDKFLAQNLLSKIWALLRVLFKGGYHLRVATNKDFTVYYMRKQHDSF